MGHVGENLRCQSIDRATDEQRMKEHVHRGVKAEPQAGIGIGCGGAVFTVLILITLKVFSHSYCWRGQLALHTVPSSADHIPDTCKLSAITPWAVPFSTELQKKISRVVWSIRAVFAFMLNPCSMQNITSAVVYLLPDWSTLWAKFLEVQLAAWMPTFSVTGVLLAVSHSFIAPNLRLYPACWKRAKVQVYLRSMCHF